MASGDPRIVRMMLEMISQDDVQAWSEPHVNYSEQCLESCVWCLSTDYSCFLFYFEQDG